jgi:hypothetical protein
MFSIYYGNKGVSLAVSDKDNYVIVRRLFDSVIRVPIFICQWEIQIYSQRNFLPYGCLHKALGTLVCAAEGLQ